jgi:hypothetical protein
MQGLDVPIFNPPPGAIIRYCNSTTPCRGRFTPFLGQRIAVGRLDDDAPLDVVVVSRTDLEGYQVGDRPPTLTSPVQVGLTPADSSYWSTLLDLTPLAAAVGGDLRGDAIAVGRIAGPGGDGDRGVIAITRATSAVAAASALRLLPFDPEVLNELGGVVTPAAFTDVTAELAPTPTATDSLQASALRFADVNDDGRDDLLLLADAAPGGTNPAFRILVAVEQEDGSAAFAESHRDLLAALQGVGESLEGSVLTLGDLDGDGGTDFVITRAVPAGAGTQTRVIATER